MTPDQFTVFIGVLEKIESSLDFIGLMIALLSLNLAFSLRRN
jgi:hypothetical protein